MSAFSHDSGCAAEHGYLLCRGAPVLRQHSTLSRRRTSAWWDRLARGAHLCLPCQGSPRTSYWRVMSGTLSLGAILRRTFGAYAERAPLLLAAALVLATVIWLDNALFKRAAAVGAGLVNLLLLALFVCFVVLAADEVWDGGTRHGTSELLRSAWSAAGRLLLVGVIAGLAIGFVGSLGSGLLVAIIIGAAFAAGANPVTFALGALLISIMLLVPELYLLTVWSVFVPVVVLEHPGGLRALRRSRELVRGNGWRVLALILMLTLPLSLGITAVEGASRMLGGGPALAGELLLATLIAPIPVLATTALYHELRGTEWTPAAARGQAPDPV